MDDFQTDDNSKLRKFSLSLLLKVTVKDIYREELGLTILEPTESNLGLKPIFNSNLKTFTKMEEHFFSEVSTLFQNRKGGWTTKINLPSFHLDVA